VADSLADKLVQSPILTSTEFCQDIKNQIDQDTSLLQLKSYAADLGNLTDVGAIGGAISSTRVNDLVTITVNWATSGGAWPSVMPLARSPPPAWASISIT